MSDNNSKNLTPADPDALADTLAHALQFNGRKRFHTADEYKSRITARHLIERLSQAGFVVYKKAPDPPRTSDQYPGPPRRS